MPESRKGPVPPSPREAAREAGAKPEKPPIVEGEVACEGCGLSITRNQEKLSRLLTGKSLCKRCMNP
jgi:formylmethanofuran dehydrogenase subunit E